MNVTEGRVAGTRTHREHDARVESQDSEILLADRGLYGSHDQPSLWSLLTVLQAYAADYLALGQRTEEVRQILRLAATNRLVGAGDNAASLSDSEKQQILGCLDQLQASCDKLTLPVSKRLMNSIGDVNLLTCDKFDMIITAISSEMEHKHLLYVPTERAKFYENPELLSGAARVAFPTVYEELLSAGNSFACALYTGCVFHSMRGAEVGVRAMGAALGVAYPDKPLDLAEWHQILDSIGSKIRDIGQRPKSEERDKDQEFYSTAAAQFRYFKDGWRVRVAHARATYTEPQALRVLDHTRDFFESLSGRLSE